LPGVAGERGDSLLGDGRRGSRCAAPRATTGADGYYEECDEACDSQLGSPGGGSGPTYRDKSSDAMQRARPAATAEYATRGD